jgi:hypothetical protein
MKTILLPALFSLVFVNGSTAQSCREVVRDASGRVVQTVDRQKQTGGTERAVIRDASGRLTGSQTTSGNCSGSNTSTQRDASNRLTGTSSTPGKCTGMPLVPIPPSGTKK